MLPILDACRNTGELDRLLNTDPLTRSPFFDGYINRLDMHLWTAYLARNPRLDALCEHILQNIGGNQYIEAARRCVEYIRSHPLS